jgi:hypothetical protein
MKTPVDARLLLEAARFGFRFACDDCVHFAPEREEEAEAEGGRRDASRSCGHGWPVRLRRSALDPAVTGGEPLAFCKEFELS